MAGIYYFREFFDLALTYFCINNSQVRLLSQIILTSSGQRRSNDYPVTQRLCSFRASVKMVASLPFKTSANVIVFVIIKLILK